MTFWLVLLSALASLLALPVGESDFRVTAGIVVLITGLLLYKKLRPLSLGLITGLAVCLMRVLVASLAGADLDVLSYFLEVFFYLGYVLVYRYAVVDCDKVYGMPLVVGLSLADFGGNTLEFFSRVLLGYENWNTTSLTTLLISALVRSVVIIVTVYVSRLVLLRLGKEVADPLAQDAAKLGLGPDKQA